MCSVEGCEGSVFSRGWCRVHWNRWRRYGDPMECRQLQGDDRARLEQYIESSDGCWLWTGQRNANGYGRAFLNGRKTYAHRAVYEVFVAPIPEGMDIDHQCHNDDLSCPGGPQCPHRPCVNPAHLRPETKRKNRGRSNERRKSPASS